MFFCTRRKVQRTWWSRGWMSPEKRREKTKSHYFVNVKKMPPEILDGTLKRVGSRFANHLSSKSRSFLALFWNPCSSDSAGRYVPHPISELGVLPLHFGSGKTSWAISFLLLVFNRLVSLLWVELWKAIFDGSIGSKKRRLPVAHHDILEVLEVKLLLIPQLLLW